MADTLKNLYGGTLGTSSATLYTVPASTKTILKEIILCNKTATDATATVTIDSKTIVGGKTVPKNETYLIEFHSVIEAGKIIAGLAGTASAIDIYISGIEVV
jgi:hypothetical protein